MKDLGELHHFLGMRVQRRDGCLLLSQHQYMLDILDRAGMAQCKPCSVRSDGETNDEEQKDQTAGNVENPSNAKGKTTGASQQELHYIGCVFTTSNGGL